MKGKSKEDVCSGLGFLNVREAEMDGRFNVRGAEKDCGFNVRGVERDFRGGLCNDVLRICTLELKTL